MTKTVAIVHRHPVEMYPPTLNIVRYLASKGWDVTLFTTAARHAPRSFLPKNVDVQSAGDLSRGSGIARIAAYARFYLGTAARLARESPDAVLYIEPESSLPPLLARLVRRHELFIHHHEYHEPAEFEQPGRRLSRVLHWMEKQFLFPSARWISHTNLERLRRFMQDNPSVPHEAARVFPNYPPASWSLEQNRAWQSGSRPLRIVYVGSLSMRDTWIEELIDWVAAFGEDRVTLDVFSYNHDDETARYLRKAAAPGIRMHDEGIPYDELPRVLRDFHVGVILYKAQTLNYRWNATNKLFEYLACGLDVVYPREMEGIRSLRRVDLLPRIVEADFKDLSKLRLDALATRATSATAPPHPSAEDAIQPLEIAMTQAVRPR